MSLTIASILTESAVRHTDRTALVLGDLRLTYAQLWAHSLQYAAVLREKGVGRGDKVALLLPNTPHFLLAYFGTLALGAELGLEDTLVTRNPKVTPGARSHTSCRNSPDSFLYGPSSQGSGY